MDRRWTALFCAATIIAAQVFCAPANAEDKLLK
jgi:hypothetical protein